MAQQKKAMEKAAAEKAAAAAEKAAAAGGKANDAAPQPAGEVEAAAAGGSSKRQAVKTHGELILILPVFYVFVVYNLSMSPNPFYSCLHPSRIEGFRGSSDIFFFISCDQQLYIIK